MSFKFEKRLIWQKAMILGKEVNLSIKPFPKIEQYNLSSQILRAVDAIALNISEGSILERCRIQEVFRLLNTLNS